MTIAVTHSTTVVTPDDGSSEVGTNEWNAAHTLTGTVSVAQGGTGQTTEAEALGEMVQALTEDTAPTVADYLLTYDASADTGKKVLITTLTDGLIPAQSNIVFYVRTDGSDSNDGLTNTSGGAFLTLHKALAETEKYDYRGLYFPTINVANGTYDAGANKSFAPQVLKRLAQTTYGKLIGNIASPGSVILTSNRAPLLVNGSWQIQGFYLNSVNAEGLKLGDAADVLADDLHFDASQECLYGSGYIFYGITNNIFEVFNNHTTTGIINCNGFFEIQSNIHINSAIAISATISGHGTLYLYGSFTGTSPTGKKYNLQHGFQYYGQSIVTPNDLPGDTDSYFTDGTCSVFGPSFGFLNRLPGKTTGGVPDSSEFDTALTWNVYTDPATDKAWLGWHNGSVVKYLEIDQNKIATPLASGLTIATGVVTATGSYHTIDTQGAAASDDLDTINGGSDGMRLVIRAVSSARTVVAKDGTGNLQLASDFTMDNAQDTLELIYDGTLTAWLELGRNDIGV